MHDCSLLIELCVSLRAGNNLSKIYSCPADTIRSVLDLVHDLCEQLSEVVPDAFSVEAFPGELGGVAILVACFITNHSPRAGLIFNNEATYVFHQFSISHRSGIIWLRV